jgi:hypothetical protein
MTAVIHLVSERQQRIAQDAAQMREDFLEKCRSSVADLDQIAGYALVVWDMRGDMRSVYSASQGPIGPSLVPTLVADALNRHVAVMLARAENDDADATR